MANTLAIEFPQFDALIAAIGLEAFKEKVRRAVRAECAVILKDAWRRTPKQTGTLRESIYQRIVEESDTRMVVELGYTAPYAGRVHEDLSMSHRVGEAKFLEYAVQSAVPTFTANVAERVKRSR